VAPAVAKAAMESGVARIKITDFDAYAIELNRRLGLDNQLSRILSNKAKSNPKRIVFADAENIKILKAAQMVIEEGIGYPILLGNEKKIRALAASNSIDLDDMPIINPQDDEHEEIRNEFGEVFFTKRNRKGINHYEALKAMKDRNHFGCMMVETGEADCMISGLSKNYPETIRPAIQIIGTDTGVKKIAGMYLLFTKRGPIFLADTTVNFNPTAEELAEITLLVAKEVRQFNITPRIAMLSYSNFGSSNTPEAILIRKAREIVKTKNPSLICDGELQGILAFNKDVLKENYPFTELVNGDVNVLIFPNLAAGNIAHNLLQEIGGADSIGPILLGLKKPVHVLQLGSSVRSIYNMVVIAVVDAQAKSKANIEEVVKKSRWWKRKPKTNP
jgi:malate dehydrogenase (oxaloacetate-decarboxylating)(NADP+)